VFQTAYLGIVFGVLWHRNFLPGTVAMNEEIEMIEKIL